MSDGTQQEETIPRVRGTIPDPGADPCVYEAAWPGFDPSWPQFLDQAALMSSGAGKGTPEFREHREEWEGALSGHEYHDWPHRQEDMALITTTWPDTVFTLRISGMDREDDAQEYYLGGRVQRAPQVVSYAPFDPGKLGPPERIPEDAGTGEEKSR